jgi:hypothetical protein
MKQIIMYVYRRAWYSYGMANNEELGDSLQNAWQKF